MDRYQAKVTVARLSWWQQRRHQGRAATAWMKKGLKLVFVSMAYSSGQVHFELSLLMTNAILKI